jgi:iron complex outermembrane receptor protein
MLFAVSSRVAAQDTADTLKTKQLQEVVVSASKLTEDINLSPVSIEKLGTAAIGQSASPSFFDAIEHVKGVQMITPSLGFKVINTRGFTTTTNVRFVQMVDGMDNQAPHIGAPIGNALGPNDLDIESVEIVPGVASALYGMNAINGLANFITKDPFKNTGFSVVQKVGVNRLGATERAQPFSETSIRWAQVLNPKLAFKINGTYLSGMDWIANDQSDLFPNGNITTGLTGDDNPAYDPVNSYGNESSNRRTLMLNGKNYVVARTGYYEKEVVDYGIRNWKGDVALHYKVKPDVQLSYTYRYANINNVYQRSNRFRLDDYQVQQHGFSYRSKSIQLKTYLNVENTGKSYNIRSMAENMDRNFKPDDTWFADYVNNYNNSVTGGLSIADAHRKARQLADVGRPQPGTEEFESLVKELGDINNWDYGAALRVRSRMFHGEGQINITERLLSSLRDKAGIELLAGFDHRTYIIIPDGNYFINPMDDGENLLYGRTGAFLQVSKGLFAQKVKLGATLRADKNDYFTVKWNPRITAVYLPAYHHSFRFSYQSGYRFPSIFEGFSNINSGGVKRVGGLPVMSNGIFENGYFRISVDAFQAAINRDVNTGGLTRNDAIVKNEGLLKKNESYTYTQPEHISSLEFGYRALLIQEVLQLDIDFYYNNYSNLMGQVELNIPKTSDPDSIAFYMADRKKQDRYRLWTNSKTIAHNYGSTLGLRYRFLKNFQALGNVTYAKLDQKSNNDGLEDGFNTPQWITNISFGNEQVFRNLGFMVTYRWQSSYYWQSFLVNGNVPAYQTLDAQVTIIIEKAKLKIGGTNILNHYYNSFLGGPAVGGFYYCSVGFHF